MIEDATHSDSPGLDQAATLRDRLGALADGAERPDRPILVAANTGMLLQLFDAWTASGAFTRLEQAVLAPLGLREPELGNNSGDLRVAVLNLDDRPTAGEGGLLREMLPLLAPDGEDGVFADSSRCASCTVSDWCPVRTNAILAAGAAADSLDNLAATAARERGRHDSPRVLWDWLSRIVAPPTAFGGTTDPCDAVAEAAQAQDETWRLRNLLPVSVFSSAGDLGRRVSSLDPSLGASKEAYVIVASAGLDPDADAARMEVLAEREPSAVALASAARDVRVAQNPTLGHTGTRRHLLARTEIGAGLLARPDEWPIDRDGAGAKFDRALSSYRDWQRAEVTGADDAQARKLRRQAAEDLEPVVVDVGQGLARLYGVLAEGRAFLPLRSYDGRSRSRVHVAVDIDLDTVRPVPDLIMERNASSATAIGHEPLEIKIEMQGAQVVLDLPAYRLLLATQGGLTAPSQSDERFHALRRAAEALARDAAEKDGAQLLVEGEVAGRSYLISQVSSLEGSRILRTRLVTS
ncbi:hypothetical protein ACFWNH_29565 [Rhodococcus qingshengii]|uniref:hypothetical protein n=1 Tax=Rhodococcus qingshengii TaxID=334542 RepID=UPI003650ADC1